MRPSRRAQIERRAIAAARGYRVQIAVGLEAPSVIGATEAPYIAARDIADERAAMAASVMEHMNFAVLVAAEHDWIPADIAGHEIAGCRHLALMPDIDEGPAEDALHLELEDGRILVDAPMNPIVAHDRRDDERRRGLQPRELRHLL